MESSLLRGACLLEVAEHPATSKVAGSTTVQRDTCPSLVFDNGILDIRNPFLIRCDSGENVDFSAIIGCSVTHSYATETEYLVVFEGRITLSVSLRDEDFIGPDAASFRANTGEVATIK